MDLDKATEVAKDKFEGKMDELFKDFAHHLPISPTILQSLCHRCFTDGVHALRDTLIEDEGTTLDDMAKEMEASNGNN
jgi:hypothetical protein